jgi:iron complex outermembrane receptor protein
VRRLTLERLLVGVSMAAFAACSAPVYAATDVAADASAAASVDADGGKLQDIVVVGEKRETKLQSVPLAITAISNATLEARNTQNLQDLEGYVPGLNITNDQGSEYVISIRGVGYETDSNPNSFPGVAFHIDGVYIAHAMAVGQGLTDVDHIEVLRGPQGTVFGETATGGAINVILKKPKLNDLSGDASVSYGSYNYVKATNAINIPLGSTVAVRLAGEYMRHDGYGYNIGIPNIAKYPLDNANNFTGRAALLWAPTNDFEATLNFAGYHTRTNGALQKLTAFYTPGGSVISDTTPGTRVVNQDLPSSYLLDTRMVYGTLRYNVSDTIVGKSVTAYQYMHHYQVSSSDRTDDPALADWLTPWEDKSKTISEEISLSSQNTHVFEWTLGSLYLHQRALQNIFEYESPTRAAFVSPTGVPYTFQTDSPYQHTSVGVYGQGILHLTDAFNLTAGLRYNYDKTSAQPFQFFKVVPPRSATSSALTGKVSADYKLTADNSVYVTGSRGYKPAGVSFVSGAPFEAGSFSSGPEFVPTSFKKETLNALEVGSKNEFFDHTLRVNAAAYYYWYHNFQFSAEDPVPFAGGTANIPSAHMWGAELESEWTATSRLSFDGSFSYNRGKFTSHYLTVNPESAAILRAQTFAALGFPFNYYYATGVEQAVAASAQDVNGKSVPKIPTYQGVFSATYKAPLGNGIATLRGEVSYRGGYDYLVFNNAQYDRVPSYTLFNMYVAYQPKDKPWRISANATNLFNKGAISSKFADPYGSYTTSVQYIPPREVFGTFSISY